MFTNLNSQSELPIKIESDDIDPPFNIQQEDYYQPMKSSSSSSSGSDTARSNHKQDESLRNGHSIKEEKKSRSSDSNRRSSSSSKHHKKHHSQSSHSDSSSSKRKHEETIVESKENKTTSSHKKPKFEEPPKEASSSHHSKGSSRHRESSGSSSSKHREKSSKASDESKIELDHSQGMGFAEALALFDMPSTSKKKDLQLADKIVKVSPKTPNKLSRDDKKLAPVKESLKSLKALTAPPKLLTQKPKLEPLPDIVNDLPSDVSIPDYRPLPLSSAVKDYINSSVLGYSCRPPQKQMTDKELLVESFSSKANRTRVFSGNRVQKSAPSLFEVCIRVLQENIDFLESTGGVPFDILRPVLERAKPDQLSVIEYYNPYLLDDSDVLWEPHCKRKFRTRQRDENETWRDLYERCTREDEIKLSRLTQNIKQHTETTSNGVQKTKMAYVDQMVKPPRNVQRQQGIFGTNRMLVASPAARTEGLKHMAPNLVSVGDARLRVAAGIRDDAQSGKLSLLIKIVVDIFNIHSRPRYATRRHQEGSDDGEDLIKV